jgi:hypothetical protein
MENFNTEDIYLIMNVTLTEADYQSLPNQEKATTLLECFNNYLCFKISQLNNTLLDDKITYNTIDYFEILNNLLTKDNQDKLSHPIHYLLSLISSIQGYECYWEIDDDVDPEKPILEIEINGKIDKIITNVDTNLVNTFGLLINKYLELLDSKCLRLLERGE